MLEGSHWFYPCGNCSTTPRQSVRKIVKQVPIMRLTTPGSWAAGICHILCYPPSVASLVDGWKDRVEVELIAFNVNIGGQVTSIVIPVLKRAQVQPQICTMRLCPLSRLVSPDFNPGQRRPQASSNGLDPVATKLRKIPRLHESQNSASLSPLQICYP